MLNWLANGLLENICCKLTNWVPRFSKNLVITPPPINLQLDRKALRKRREKKLCKNLNLADSSQSHPGAEGDIESSVTAYEGCPLVRHCKVVLSTIIAVYIFQQMQAPAENNVSVVNENSAQHEQPAQNVPVPSAPPYMWESQWQKVEPEPLIWPPPPPSNMFPSPDVIPYHGMQLIFTYLRLWH